ncbi:class I SAM-dependent methyltransferase [Benzoatithermus flavus]|uniref:Class I SAM-dependent methyltransferase n=1 Tax=Benzoatithermus flavus TaxID=3108223 RepID=A0ABU8XPW8_9PROT
MRSPVRSHESLVVDQFGGQAHAYLASTVHAQGEDLEQLAAMARARPEAVVLDLGCGAGHVSFHVAPHVASVTACDLSEAMLAVVARTAAERGLRNVATRAGAAERLPFADAAFDLVLSRYSAHHWLDLGLALREVRRVLKPGGQAVFVDVMSPGAPLLDTFLQTVEMLRDPSHGRNYGADEWLRLVAEAGLIPESFTRRRLRLEFASWVARMRTPELHVQAIRSLQAAAPAEVRAHFAIEPDGSFTIDTMTLEAS